MSSEAIERKRKRFAWWPTCGALRMQLRGYHLGKWCRSGDEPYLTDHFAEQQELYLIQDFFSYCL